MGFYSRVIFPRLMELNISRADLNGCRQALLADVQGQVLEIGFGTGLNLSYYPEHIRAITAVDVNEGVRPLARKRIEASPIEVNLYIQSAEALPFPDGSFDSVVSAWTLCSIRDIEGALAEIYRVLRPGGRFFFVEHGLSPEEKVQVWQRRLTPLQRIVAGGYHLNRDIRTLVENQGFQIITLDEFNLDRQPTFLDKIMRHTYQGIAGKPNRYGEDHSG